MKKKKLTKNKKNDTFYQAHQWPLLMCPLTSSEFRHSLNPIIHENINMEIKYSLMDILLLIGAVQGFFLSIILKEGYYVKNTLI
jgi:hypothetical protein